MGVKEETIEKIDTDVFNSTHKVELPNNRYTRRATLTTDLGSFSDSSSFQSDADVDLYDAVKLNANGEIFEVDGQLLDYMNTMTDSIQIQDQLDVALQVAYHNALTGEVKGSDFSTLRLELDTAQVSDISDGSESSHNDDAQITVSGELASSGTTRAMPKISKSVEDISTGQNNFRLRQNGIWQAVIFEEEGCSLDDLKVEVNVPGDEIVVVDDPTEVIRRRNVRQAGTSALPSGYFYVDLTKSDRFNSDEVNYVDITTNASSDGSLAVWNNTVVPTQ